MNTQLKIVIIDDEKAAQELLSSILISYCDGIEVVGYGSTLDEGRRLILELSPDIVYMDVELGQTNAFDLLETIETRDFQLVMTTAHEGYAYRAFKCFAVDYILKPYAPKTIISSLARIKAKLSKENSLDRLEQMIHSRQDHADDQMVGIPTADGLLVIEANDIVRIEASGSYSQIHTHSSKTNLVSKSLKELELILMGFSFFRPHDSHLINMKHVRGYFKEDGGTILLSDGVQVPVSRRKKVEFLSRLTAK